VPVTGTLATIASVGEGRGKGRRCPVFPWPDLATLLCEGLQCWQFWVSFYHSLPLRSRVSRRSTVARYRHTRPSIFKKILIRVVWWYAKIQNPGVWPKATPRNPDSLVVSGIDTSGVCCGQHSSAVHPGSVRFFPRTALIHNWLNRPVTSLRWSAENACLASWPKKLKLRASELVIRAAIIFRVVEPTSLPPFKPKNVA